MNFHELKPDDVPFISIENYSRKDFKQYERLQSPDISRYIDSKYGPDTYKNFSKNCVEHLKKQEEKNKHLRSGGSSKSTDRK